MTAYETFSNNATTTVTSGGTTAPAAGTSESWTVASSASFPAAATGVSWFHVADPNATSEKILVTNVSGTTWTVTRGAESTTPVTHAAGFTVNQVVTAGWLGGAMTLTGTGTGIQVPGANPFFPAVLSPAKWALVNFDAGPDVISAVYANNSTSPALAASYPVYENALDTTSLVTPSFTPAAGELIVVKAVTGDNTLIPGTPAGGSIPFTLIVSDVNGSNSSVYIWVGTVPASPASMTVTLPFTGSGQYHSMVAERWTNAAWAADIAATPAFTGYASGGGSGLPSVTAVAKLAGAAVSWCSGDWNAVDGTSRAYITTSGTVTEDGYTRTAGQYAAYYARQTVTASGNQTFGLTAPGSQKWQAAGVLILPADGGPGATLTASANGVLAVDSGSPAVSDRVAVADPFNNDGRDGIYTVTSVGSAGSKWVLTRASDHNTAATLGQYWTVPVTAGAVWQYGNVTVASVYGQNSPGTFVVGASVLYLSAAGGGAYAAGPACTAAGSSSAAIGTQSSVWAAAENSVALGDTSTVTAGHSMGLGPNVRVDAGNAVGIGSNSYNAAPARASVTLGSYTLAWTPDQVAISSGEISTQGDCQSSVITAGGQTANATPLVIAPPDGTITFNDKSGNASWKKTILVRLFAVARRKDTPGTDSSWSAQGTLRGNGSNSYSWIGGSAPSFTVINQDAGASAWAVAASISSNTLVITVTGASGATINWSVTAELCEVVG